MYRHLHKRSMIRQDKKLPISVAANKGNHDHRFNHHPCFSSSPLPLSPYSWTQSVIFRLSYRARLVIFICSQPSLQKSPTACKPRVSSSSGGPYQFTPPPCRSLFITGVSPSLRRGHVIYTTIFVGLFQSSRASRIGMGIVLQALWFIGRIGR